MIAYVDTVGSLWLRRVLAPRAVAVIGAGQHHGGAGHEALRALRDYGFAGRLFAVNECGRPVCGIPAYRSVAALPGPVDLLVLALPEEQAADALADAGTLGVHAAILLDTRSLDAPPTPWPTGGVAAAGRWGRRITQVARSQRIRLLGPASLGVLNTDPTVRLNASLSPARPPAGGLAVAVWSGAMGIALLADAVREHCGISTMVSLGGEADVSGADLLAHWLEDPATRAVALAPESFAEPHRFAHLARAVGRRKPVLAVAGAVAGNELLAGTGVIRTASLGETLDTARVLVDQPLPTGNRLAVIGNAGGLTALATRSAMADGFDVVPIVPGAYDPDGVDLAPPRTRIAETVAAACGNVDVLLLTLVGTRANALAATVAELAPVLDAHPGLTVAAVVVDGTEQVHTLGHRGAPVFSEPEQAVRALAHARDYAVWRRDAPDEPSTRLTRAAPPVPSLS